jgi:hypothetical protein
MRAIIGSGSPPRSLFTGSQASCSRPHTPSVGQWRQRRGSPTRFCPGFLWDFSAELPIELLLEAIPPDPAGALDMLLERLRDPCLNNQAAPPIVHDLLEIAFPNGCWRDARPPPALRQREVLGAIAREERAWGDPPRLWFLFRELSVSITRITAEDLRPMRLSEKAPALLRAERVTGRRPLAHPAGTAPSLGVDEPSHAPVRLATAIGRRRVSKGRARSRPRSGGHSREGRAYSGYNAAVPNPKARADSTVFVNARLRTRPLGRRDFGGGGAWTMFNRLPQQPSDRR